MTIRTDEMKEILRSPRESFDTELKSWFDPQTPEGIAKIAKACIALRNNNGGILIVGFDDSGKPCGPSQLHDIEGAFHVDEIQAIVSRYASKQFEIFVDFAELDGAKYPIISVPSGVETPVASKRELADPANTRAPLIRCDAVYVRTTNSNGTVSSSIAKHGDYERLTKICFDNKEADIAGFVRRQLAGMQQGELGPAIAAFLSPSKPVPTATESAVTFLDFGKSRFESESASRKLNLPKVAVREVSVVIDGQFPPQSADQAFMQLLQFNKPHHSGWSPWIDTTNASDENDRAYTFEGGWESLIVEIDPRSFWGMHIDFWRMEPAGRFYYLSGLQEDLPHPRARNPEPGTIVDFLLQISRVTDAVSAGMSFARSLGCDELKTNVAIAIRWSGLTSRQLTSWVEPQRSFHSRGSSRQDTVLSQVVIPLESAQSGLIPFIERLVTPLFLCFGGMKFDSSVIAGIAAGTLERRM